MLQKCARIFDALDKHLCQVFGLISTFLIIFCLHFPLLTAISNIFLIWSILVYCGQILIFFYVSGPSWSKAGPERDFQGFSADIGLILGKWWVGGWVDPNGGEKKIFWDVVLCEGHCPWTTVNGTPTLGKGVATPTHPPALETQYPPPPPGGKRG